MKNITTEWTPYPLDKVYKITNNVELWPKLFEQYTKVEIIKKTSTYVKFKLFICENHQEFSWISERKLDIENNIVYGQRLDPKYPFNYMKLRWFYTALNNGTKITWIQEFEPNSILESQQKEKLIAHMNNSDITMSKFIGKVNEFIKEEN